MRGTARKRIAATGARHLKKNPMNIESLESRLTDLEVKISFNEHLVEELNNTVYRQQQQIDLLVTEIVALRDQVKSQPQGEQRSLRDEIPPHY